MVQLPESALGNLPRFYCTMARYGRSSVRGDFPESGGDGVGDAGLSSRLFSVRRHRSISPWITMGATMMPTGSSAASPAGIPWEVPRTQNLINEANLLNSLHSELRSTL